MQPYDYPTPPTGPPNIFWHIFEDAFEQGHLERYVPGRYGLQLVHVGIYGSALAAERAADSIEWAEHPVERDAEQPHSACREGRMNAFPWCVTVDGEVVAACRRETLAIILATAIREIYSENEFLRSKKVTVVEREVEQSIPLAERAA